MNITHSRKQSSRTYQVIAPQLRISKTNKQKNPSKLDSFRLQIVKLLGKTHKISILNKLKTHKRELKPEGTREYF